MTDNEEDIFKVLSDFMKGKSGNPDMAMAKLSWEGESPTDLPEPPRMSQTYSEFAQEYSTVVSGLRGCLFGHCAALIGSMLTLPEFQSNTYRLSILAHLAAMFSKGKKRPTPAQIAAWFNQLDRGTCGRQEDPAEDLFISNVYFGPNNFRLFESTCEGNAFYTQLFLNILSDMPNKDGYLHMKQSVAALLTLSEEVANRADLARNIVGNAIPVGEIHKPSTQVFRELRSRVLFTPEQFSELGISAAAIAPFIASQSELKSLNEYSPGLSPLEFKPVVMDRGNYVLCLPNLVGTTIREFIIGSCSQAGMIKSLEVSLANAYATRLSEESFLGELKNVPVYFTAHDTFHAFNTSIEIDAGRYLHLLFFVDGFTNHENGMFLGINPVEPISQFVKKAISKVSGEISSTEGFRDGLTLVIGCGWGRSIGLDLPEDKPNWNVQLLSAHDLITLSGSEGITPLHMWRIMDAEDAISAMEIELVNINGFLNLYSWMKKNDWHIVPHEKLDPDFIGKSGRASLTIPQNGLLNLRREVAHTHDIHVVTRPNGTAAMVRRVNVAPRYGTKELAPFYADIEALHNQLFRSVYEGAQCNYWAEAFTSSNLDLHTKHQLSLMVMNWSEATFRFFETIDIHRHGKSFSCSFEFLDNKIPTGGAPIPSEAEIATLIESIVDEANGGVKFVVQEGFLAAGRRVDNLVERQVVISLVRACLIWGEKDASEADILDIVQKIVKGDNARHFHAFSMPDTRDFVRESLPLHYQIIEKLDDANSRLGLGWLTRERAAGGDVKGLSECSEYLNNLVASIVERIKQDVSRFNRELLIKNLMINHEALFMEMVTWKRTFNAVRALSEDAGFATQQVGEKIAQLNAASMSSRIVAEVALCESPLVGGLTPGNYDLAKLLVDASLIFHMGGYSDVMNVGMMPPEIRISPAGDVLMNHDFTDAVVRPFGEKFQAISLDDAARDYADNYAQPLEEDVSQADLEESEQSSEFEAAWFDEFGLSVDDTKQFVQGFHSLIDKEGKAVIVEDLTDFSSRLSDTAELDIEIINRCIEVFSLKPRPKWNEAPIGFSNSSWFPWRFQRQLSLVSRPIIHLENKPSTKCIIVPAMVIQNIAKLFSDARFGTVDQKMFKPNGKLARWIGKINGQQGEAFNEQVALRFIECGWQARANMSDGEILDRKKVPSFGDVDVLAWSSECKTVAVIECKDLSLDKTPGEIARRLSKYQGSKMPNGKRDYLLKHLDRCETIEGERERLANFVGFEVERIERMIVFSAATPIQYSDVVSEYKVTMATYTGIQDWIYSVVTA